MTEKTQPKTVTIYGVIYTAADETTTTHTAHLTEHDAIRAGDEFARSEYSTLVFAEPMEDDDDPMDALRQATPVRLEVEPIAISHEVIRALYAQISTGA